MIVNEFRFLSPDEPFMDPSFRNWSRPYEWGYALREMEKLSGRITHNTCCGGGEIHKEFHDALMKINSMVINSNDVSTEINKKFANFQLHNLLIPSTYKFDVVLCISSLEHIDPPEMALYNLCKQTKKKGRLIITCDYPDISTQLLEDAVGAKCADVSVRLNGTNSRFPQPQFEHLNIILLDLTL